MGTFGAPRERHDVSVCMAAYNGQEYIIEQVASIVSQLRPSDELIVTDDSSTDDTVQKLREFNDNRIHIIQSAQNAGHVRTFETSLEHARHEIVVLADQDDVWPDGRLDALLLALQDNDFVVGRYEVPDLGGSLHHSNIRAADSDRPVVNLIGLFAGRRAYMGSTMAFRRSILELALPFPANTKAHDHWLPILALMTGRVAHLDDVVTLRRLHATNLTPSRRRGLMDIINTRLLMASHLAEALLRKRSKG